MIFWKWGVFRKIGFATDSSASQLQKVKAPLCSMRQTRPGNGILGCVIFAQDSRNLLYCACAWLTAWFV